MSDDYETDQSDSIQGLRENTRKVLRARKLSGFHSPSFDTFTVCDAAHLLPKHVEIYRYLNNIFNLHTATHSSCSGSCIELVLSWPVREAHEGKRSNGSH